MRFENERYLVLYWWKMNFTVRNFPENYQSCVERVHKMYSHFTYSFNYISIWTLDLCIFSSVMNFILRDIVVINQIWLTNIIFPVKVTSQYHSMVLILILVISGYTCSPRLPTVFSFLQTILWPEISSESIKCYQVMGHICGTFLSKI